MKAKTKSPLGDIATSTITMKVKDLVPYLKNPRVNDQNVPTIKDSLERFGYVTRIIVDRNGVIVSGHTRLKAMIELGWQEKEIEVTRYDADEKTIRAFRLVDNKSAEGSDWDDALLIPELEDLSDLGEDMSLFGFEDIEEDLEPVEEHEVRPIGKVFVLIAADVNVYDRVAPAVASLSGIPGVEVDEVNQD